ncbi:HNH endonuclease [Zavarzinella formosa]|uniref:HNH endonuclease n=1 Tax=Zavarzinella formosa TaxID=360055 RepID=UPI001EE66469|nr:HNH endonuclease [Zavarzinella formosa]
MPKGSNPRYGRRVQIELAQGHTAVIDDEDADMILSHKWHASRGSCGKVHAVTTAWDRDKQKHHNIRMHRLILGAKPGEMVDHITGDTLDNRRQNLRICTNAENQQNSGQRRGSSKYKGVAWYSRHGKWRVMFNWKGKTHFVGYFDSEVEAALAYNKAVLPLAGEFARLNIIP